MYPGLADSVGSEPRERPRSLRPIGTAARAIAGGALIVIPITSHGLAAWDALGALVILPALAVALDRLLGVGIARFAEATGRLGSDATRTWAFHLSALILVVAIATVLTFLTAIDAGAIWLFFGVSLVVVAVRGDAGCEALAIPNAIFGRREQTGCVAFALIDSLEA
jgi:hypothetical protein